MSLVSREMPIKTIVRCHFILARVAIIIIIKMEKVSLVRKGGWQRALSPDYQG